MTEPRTIHFEGGAILAGDEPLTIRGLLLPYNEEGRTNVGRFQVEAGAVAIPTDPLAVGINNDHVRHDVLGRAMTLTETPEGVMATFKFADTEEGRAAHADAINPNGKRRKLSAEFGPAYIKAGKLVAGHAKLWGAALVEAGAFPSAQVLAADSPDAPADPAAAAPVDDPAHLVVAVDTLPDDITATTPSGDVAVYEPTAAPAQETNPEGASNVTATATPAGAPAAVPATIPGAPGNVFASIQTTEQSAHDLGMIFGAMAQIKGGIPDADAHQVLADLSDILTTGLPATGVLRENWVGKVWQGKTYTRKFIGLATLGTDISLAGKKGFKLDQGSALVQAWAGNKADIPSGTATTKVVGSTLRKYGYAADIAREFYDLPGGAEVIEAFVRGVVDSYAKVTDLDALNDIVKTAAWNGSGAWGSNVTGVIAPDTYPGVDGHNYTGAIGQLIQAITAVQDADDDPSFALVNAAAWKQLIYTPKDLIPEFVTFGFNTDGTGEADGKVHVVKAPDSGFTLSGNVYTTAPCVVVGAKQGIQFDELGEVPLQLDALDIARGGIDKAVIGYLQTFVVRPESFKFVGVKNA